MELMKSSSWSLPPFMYGSRRHDLFLSKSSLRSEWSLWPLLVFSLARFHGKRYRMEDKQKIRSSTDERPSGWCHVGVKSSFTRWRSCVVKVSMRSVDSLSEFVYLASHIGEWMLKSPCISTTSVKFRKEVRRLWTAASRVFGGL